MVLFPNVVCDQSTRLFVSNLTSTYVNQSNEASMVAASVIMFVLAGVFFNLNLFSGISDVSAILDPKVRLVLSSALSLLLPVMSYLFSEAKNAGKASSSTATPAGAVAGAATDLPLQALVILLWMLLVELLRKKVDEIRMKGISSTLQRAGRVVWLGSLVFFTVRSAGRKIVFGVLWILCATTVLQRIAFTEFGKRSYAHGKNARLIASYMAQILGHGDGGKNEKQAGAAAAELATAVPVVHRDVENGAAPPRTPEQLLKTCRYIVVGEDELAKEATADGYDLSVHKTPTGVVVAPGFVTVGDVWSLPDTDSTFADWDGDQRLRRLCLSFALFKLLRRRFEQHEPLTEAEATNGRELILEGLYRNRAKHGDGATAATTTTTDSEAVFRVITDDVNFLSEYYHSVVPVIFASPFFLLANYLLLPVVVLGLCLMTVFLCGNGDWGYALASVRADNYTLNTGVRNLTRCLLNEVIKSPNSFYAVLDLAITFLLSVIFVYESVWEVAVFLLSNWFMVALVCDYAARPAWREKPAFRWGFRRVRWLRSRMSHGELTIKQLSVLNLRWPPVLPLPSTLALLVRARTVPACVKDSIMEYLVAHDPAAPIAIGTPVRADQDLKWAIKSKSIAEVILAWHIATTIFEGEFPSHHASSDSIVATRLSRYCAYLVIFHPELLPDNQDKTEDVVEKMKEELRDGLGWLEFFFYGQAARVKRIMKLEGERRWTEKKVVKNGVTLGASLRARAARPNHPGSVWKMLADVWTEIMIYLAPSTDEERMKGHENALVEGGEFITVLWALTTHTGISRQTMPGGGQGGEDDDRTKRAAGSPGSGH